ncbi:MULTISPECIES: ABC transporter substrate-binding protein [unclassified Chelatococcus]|uniref:ABC transporter substrate-binding protein n=1 Tax=unclassified Chelatococcus TaxID=2638111 RepID=UPI001BCAE43C|nr:MULTISPECIES: ABC transporter substrate-binding protein [unclassified Chelatococcus]MBS7701108.1 ABC transporter substrate-binding protein [Chelatococcus sp. YT9]MBX3557239.1 ABC transporter substrate-binding protein [Chelatococcus sp.]
MLTSQRALGRAILYLSIGCGVLGISDLNVRTALAADYKEAPSLAKEVAAGKLPPVAQRLPETPLVVKPVNSIGSYGGTWRQALVGASDGLLERTIGYTRLVRWDPQWTGVVPDVAESYSVNSDGTVYTFKLRKGIKWSDGTPFTADDILFWYNDILMNKEITPAVPRWLRSGNDPVVVSKLDDSTIQFSFKTPNGMLLYYLASNLGSDILAGSPAHYLKKFHKAHNPDVDQLVKAAGAPSWVALIQAKVGNWQSPDRWRDAARPVLDPWKLTVPYTGTTQVVAERNPYYFKVDPEGNQLPYIDRVTYDVMGDVQSVILKATNGGLDMQAQRLNSLETGMVLAAHREQGGYKLFKVQPAWSNGMLICLNQTVKNPVLRQVFQNKDFRIGLSLAINRDEINDILYAGQSRPYQAVPRPGTALYDEKLATQYTKFDVKAANEAIDRSGFTKRDDQGYRIGPDGKRIAFSIDVQTARKDHIDALELIRKYWKAVGVDMQPKPIESSFAVARMLANDQEGLVWIGGGGYDFLGLLDPKWYFPYENQSAFGSAWGIYYQNPKDPNAEEPPAWAKKQQDLYTELLKTVSDEGKLALMRQILAITGEEFPVIGTDMDPDNYGVVKTNFHNVPEIMPDTAFYVTPGPTNPEQYYMK